ncbi:fhkC [Symbiodinium natans]|uniref:FhkC protein n=1 Tax=Symbiodinium natans TaxID=878477 RepID=A0A812L662_9DINO|nr:fhkC [Symbiodinium natans]
MLKERAATRHALKLELPDVPFDDELLEHLATVDTEAKDALEAWLPFLISHSVASDEESASEVFRRLAARLQSLARQSEDFGARSSSPRPSQPSRPEASTATEQGAPPIPGLEDWLETLSLSAYLPKARAWCSKVGVATLQQVMEKWEELATELQLKELPKRRMRKAVEAWRPSNSVLVSAAACDRDDRTSADQIARASAERRLFGPDDDPYVVLDKLGGGGQGTVHRCWRPKHKGEEFAVKKIALQKQFRLQRDADRTKEKLKAEANILFSLRHSHIVQLFDVVETKEWLYLVMELVEGGELFDHIVKHKYKHLSEHEARYVFLQLADALRYIHSKGVVHRDLKPENILVDRKASRNGLLEVKITDFGYAKLVDDGYSTALTQVGTPQYWAPEVSDAGVCARGYDERVDLWSLGVVLYVMLEGVYPFSSEEQIKQASFKFHQPTTATAKDLIRALIQVRPEDRLGLDDCLKHSWVTTDTRLASTLKPSGPEGDIECFNLGREPSNVVELKSELQKFMTKFKVSAQLKKRQVEVTWSKNVDREATQR